MSKKVIVIGAGIAGMSAAIYAQRSGFDVTLMEQHSMVGGMCTSWKRKGYLFEGAVHWLAGSGSNFKEYHELWKETGALNEDVPIFYHDPIRSIEWNGQLIHLYRDIDKTAEHLLKIAPEDEPLIRQLVKDVKTVSKMPMPVFDIKGVKTQNPKHIELHSLFKMLPVLLLMWGRMGKLTCLEYAQQYTHPGLRQLFLFLADEYAAYSLIITLGTKACDGGYPEGGSLAMVHRMSKTFTDLGGKLLLNTKVQKVSIQDGMATGVILENGTLHADAVIVTQETIAAMNKLFDTPPQDVWLKKLHRTVKPALCTFVGVGVRVKLPGYLLPEWSLDTPITFAGQSIKKLNFQNYSSYGGYAPLGGGIPDH